MKNHRYGSFWMALAVLVPAFVATAPGQPVRFSAQNLSSKARLGAAVAFDAFDGKYAVIGAPDDDNVKGTDAGAVFVFKRTLTGWVLQKKLLAGDGAAGDSFGHSVSIWNSYIIVGAPYDTNGKGTRAGAAYLFELTPDNKWIQKQKLTARDGASYDRFGSKVSIWGNHAVVSAPYDGNEKGAWAGAAYVFQNTGTAGWSQQQKLMASDGMSYDLFGWSVSIHYQHIAIGAQWDDNAKGTDAGAVYVFRSLSDDGWTQQQKLTASDGRGRDYFGASVSISGNYLAVGAPGKDLSNKYDAGAAYVFQQNSTAWASMYKITAVDGEAYDKFGSAVANWSGMVAVGAPYADTERGSDAGAAYVFMQRLAYVVDMGGYDYEFFEWTEKAKLVDGDGHASDRFGTSVSIFTAGILAGAPYYGDDDRGSAFLFNYWSQTTAGKTVVDDPEVTQPVSRTDREGSQLPQQLVLHGNYPNPFNPATTVRFDLPEAAHVTLEVVDLLGRVALRLEESRMEAGVNRKLQVDAAELASGAYVYRLTARSDGQMWHASGRMLLVK